MAMFQQQATFRVPFETVVPGRPAAAWMNCIALAAPVAPPWSGVRVCCTKKSARLARTSLRVTKVPASESGPGIPSRCSLNIAVFDVPSVTDPIVTIPLFALLYHLFLPGMIVPDHWLIGPGPPTFAA